MSAENLSYNFGVKAAIFYNRDTFIPVGIFRVISSIELAREIEKLELTGGHNNGPYAVEAGQPVNTLTGTLMEFPNFAFTELDNATATIITGEDTSGNVTTITNKVGTSIADATTGIASVAAISGSEGKLPLGKIIVVGTSVASEVDVYLLGDTASGSIPVVDELSLLAAGVVVPGTGGTIQLADYGIEITGGSGSVAFTENDTAYFDTRPANTKTTVIAMKDQADIKNLGMILVYPKNSQKEQEIVDFPCVAVGGTPFAANTREYAEFEFTGTPLYDKDRDSLYTITKITATN